MDSLDEPNAQSFIVKVWVEDSAGDGSCGVWHGHITHVPSNQRRYLKNLDEIKDYIAPYLEEMGVKPGMLSRLRRQVKRLMRRD